MDPAVPTAGMFVELDQGLHPSPAQSIRDNLAAEPLPDGDRVTAYLAAGHPLIDMMGVETDYLNPTWEYLGGSSILTDGRWLWRRDFACYVRRHHVLVPPELLGRIRGFGHEVPACSVERLTELSAVAVRYAFGPGGGVRPV